MHKPILDVRDAGDLLEEAARLAEQYLPEWYAVWPEDWRTNHKLKEPGVVLVRVFSHLAAIVLARWNRAPYKHELAFYNFLGVDRLDPSAAEVPLCFSLLPGLSRALVPRRTEVLAVRQTGGGRVIFETRRNLTVVPAQLTAGIFARPSEDAYVDLTDSIVGSDLRAGRPAQSVVPTGKRNDGFYIQDRDGDLALPHELYLGLSVLAGAAPLGRRERRREPRREAVLRRKAVAALPPFDKVRLRITGRNLERLYFDRWFLPAKTAGDEPEPLKFDSPPIYDRRADQLTVTFRKFNLPEERSLGDDTEHWLGVGPGRPIGAATGAILLPEIQDLRLDFHNTGEFAEHLLNNDTRLNPKKSFQPFGKRPDADEVFYAGSQSVLQWTGAAVQIEVQLEQRLPDVQVRLLWQYWNGDDWELLGRSSQDGREFEENRAWNFQDGTAALTRDGAILFTVPETAPLKLGMKVSRWIRAVIEEGSYSLPEAPSMLSDARKVISRVPPKLMPAAQKRKILEEFQRRQDQQPPGRRKPEYHPPVLKSMRWNYAVRNVPVITASTRNNFFRRAVDAGTDSPLPPFVPYSPLDHRSAGECHLYLGFDRDEALPGAEINLFFAFNSLLPFSHNTQEVSKEMFTNRSFFWPEWSYFSGEDWRPLKLMEQFHRERVFQNGGIVGLTVPADIQAVVLDFGSSADQKKRRRSAQRAAATAKAAGARDVRPGERYWIRLSAPREAWDSLPICYGVFPNAVPASHSVEYHQNLLGSGTGRQTQQVRIPHVPVLGQPVVQVREAFRPTDGEIQEIRSNLATAFLTIPPVVEEDEESGEYWVTYYETHSFALAHAGSRCFVLDDEAGMLTFGDGRHGSVPPRLRNNIRATYRSGGGGAGNVAPGSLSELRRYIAGVRSVSNPINASGGADREAEEDARKRAASSIKNLDRAVSASDFEDLARNFSANVVRAACVSFPPDAGPGEIEELRVIILPGGQHRADDPGAPDLEGATPQLGLLEDVESYLKQRAFFPLRNRLSVRVPAFVRVDITLRVRLFEGYNAEEVCKHLRALLRNYLDPISGARGRGWNFGEDITESMVAGFVQDFQEVRNIISLRVSAGRDGSASARGIVRDRTEIVAPGNIQVSPGGEEEPA